MIIQTSKSTYDRLIRIYKNITGLDPFIHYSTNDPIELLEKMINEIGDLLGIK